MLENEKVIYVEPSKKVRMKEVAREKFDYALTWCKEHKEVIFVMGPVLVSGVIDLVKIAAKEKRTHEERYLKERMIYDRSKGHYVETRRKLKPSEWAEFDDRRDNGENVSTILRSMGLLKN